MSDTLQVADLVNGKLDTDSLAGVAMVGTTADTITNREGVEIDTLEGRLKKVGFEPPLPYAAGIEFLTPADAVKSFDQGGIIYGCLASSRPFTTTGNFAADEVNFFVIQNTSGVVQGNVRTDLSNAYAPGTTQNFAAATADTMSVGGVDVTAKNAAQDKSFTSLFSEANNLSQAQTDGVNNCEILWSRVGNSSVQDSQISINISGSEAYRITAIAAVGRISPESIQEIVRSRLEMNPLSGANNGVFSGGNHTSTDASNKDARISHQSYKNESTENSAFPEQALINPSDSSAHAVVNYELILKPSSPIDSYEIYLDVSSGNRPTNDPYLSLKVERIQGLII
jgi:hypothetical protein